MKNLHIFGILVGLALLGCGGEEEADGQAALLDPATGAGSEASTSAEVIGTDIESGAACLKSPLVGTCFDAIHDTCLQPEGACLEEVPNGVENTWTWDNGAEMRFEYKGVNDETGESISEVTGLSAEGETCITGVVSLDFFNYSRVMTVMVGDEVLQRSEFFGDGSYVDYICGDGTYTRVTGADIPYADACLFGAYAEPCGFLQPVGSVAEPVE
jgi:hypothetical protein